MTVFYIIRHGETEPNTRFACLGRSDVPLNEHGEEQAEAVCKRLCAVDADAVYVSPLKRALQTIEPYLTEKGIKPVMEQGIIERDFGEWEDMTFEQIREADPVRYEKWQRDFVGYAVPGGESSAQIQQRVNDTIDRISAEHDGETVFLVTHLGAARHIISYCLGLTPEESWRFTLNNGSYAVIDYDREKRNGLLRYLNI